MQILITFHLLVVVRTFQGEIQNDTDKRRLCTADVLAIPLFILLSFPLFYIAFQNDGYDQIELIYFVSLESVIAVL
jgi:hypothetical protein